MKPKSPHTAKYHFLLLSTALFFAGIACVSAQSNITFDLKKPKAYESRKLASEMTTEGKINPIKKVKENVVSHYNFFFNAHLKIEAVLQGAKQAHKDSFNNLIPFYSFSLDQTASQQQDLDSVIMKTNNGILLHDLRSDWVDDLYLLMGQSYFYQKKFDSAYDVFQYINYTFQPREKDERGLEKSIGSNINNTGNVFTISSPERKGIRASMTHRSIRNDALMWVARTLIEQDNDDDARGMIETLYRDNLFPKRLKYELAEIKAYWLYRKSEYDSAAHYLERAIGAAAGNAEKARRYFLIGQLYARAGKNQKADRSYEKAVSLTTNPIMEAYARINQVVLTTNNEDRDKKIASNVKTLLQMANREKYVAYRSIIFAAAAEMELSRNNAQAAIPLLLKSNAYNSDDLALRNRTHLSIAELAFSLKQFGLAKLHYDSLNTDNLAAPEAILNKKSVVAALDAYHRVVEREDSLQRIAAMPEKERLIYLSDLLKKMSKEKGVPPQNENAKGYAASQNMFADQSTEGLFPAAQKKGEWYFNNPALKAQGNIAFKTKWGTRPNADNWRRAAALSATFNSKPQNNQTGASLPTTDTTATPLTMEGLAMAIPVSEAQLMESNAKKFEAYRKLGILYKDKLDECKESVQWNERLISQRPGDPNLENILFDLAYCYSNLANKPKADFYTAQLQKNFSASAYNLMLKDPAAALQVNEQKNTAATARYSQIYNLFLEGKFETALKEKERADAAFGKNNWTPQLLFIESVYYVQTKQDSLAVATLNTIPAMYPGTPMAMKAGQLADVVTRRAEIENELKDKEVTRAETETLPWIDDSPAVKARERIAKTDSSTKQAVQPITNNKTRMDSTVFNVPVIQRKEGYQFEPTEQHMVVLLLDAVDLVYVNEAKRALSRYHAERFSPSKLTMVNETIGSQQAILIQSFLNAVEALNYTDKTIPIASREIFPWLPVEKFRFIIVSTSNLERLKVEKDIEHYIRFIQLQVPGKF